jgi:glycosyltransferase involved in cell wall biosynthesis
MKAIIESHGLNNFTLMTDFQSDGFLKKEISNDIISINYSFKGKGLGTIYQLFRYALISLFKLLYLPIIRKTNVFYINAISPWTTAIVGWIFNKKVIYHIHEYYVNPSFHIKFYIWIMSLTANELIFVSNFTKEKYLKEYPKLKKINSSIKFTPVRFETLSFEDLNVTVKFGGPIVLVCAPKIYKGVEVFVKLAEQTPSKLFKLYLNGDYFFNYKLPKNLEVFIKHNDIKTALIEASICLNLTQKNLTQETFGLTIWESLTQGTPVIVPDVGGPLEIIDSNCGISCDTRDTEQVINGVSKILESKSIYSKYCQAALNRSISLGQINNILKINS